VLFFSFLRKLDNGIFLVPFIQDKFASDDLHALRLTLRTENVADLARRKNRVFKNFSFYKLAGFQSILCLSYDIFTYIALADVDDCILFCGMTP